jgi:hypothetical protein
MKRDKSLQPLSHDHHHDLHLGWKIRQGLKYCIRRGLIVEALSGLIGTLDDQQEDPAAL